MTDHFIKPDNDMYDPTTQPYDEPFKHVDSDTELLRGMLLIERRISAELRQEKADIQRNLRHWREECGKLHSQIGKLKADLQAWEITAQMISEAEDKDILSEREDR